MLSAYNNFLWQYRIALLCGQARTGAESHTLTAQVPFFIFVISRARPPPLWVISMGRGDKSEADTFNMEQ